MASEPSEWATFSAVVLNSFAALAAVLLSLRLTPLPLALDGVISQSICSREPQRHPSSTGLGTCPQFAHVSVSWLADGVCFEFGRGFLIMTAEGRLCGSLDSRPSTGSRLCDVSGVAGGVRNELACFVERSV